jgi:hypothetical protein
VGLAFHGGEEGGGRRRGKIRRMGKAKRAHQRPEYGLG